MLGMGYHVLGSVRPLLIIIHVGVFLGPGGGIIFSLSACCAGGLGTGVCLALPLGSDGSGLTPPSLSLLYHSFWPLLITLGPWLCSVPGTNSLSVPSLRFLDCENDLPCERNSCRCTI